MVSALARVRTTYFDERPVSGILSCFLHDFANVRTWGIIRFGDSLNALGEILAVAILVFFVHPALAFIILPLLGVVFWLQKSISPMLGHGEKLTAEAKGRVLSRITDIIEGHRIFDLYGQRNTLFQRLRQSYRGYLDTVILAGRLDAWGVTWMTMISSLYSFMVIFFLVSASSSQLLTPTLVAVVLSALFSFSGSLQWLNWCLTHMTETAGNTRRIFNIVDLPHEKDEEFAPSYVRSPQGLQSSKVDVIEFENFTMSYRQDLPAVLHEIKLTLPLGQKIALVGRTGSGKTSLIQALFRMGYVHQGDIRIQGASIFDGAAEEVRQQFGVVPQSPYLFAGTVRSNIDRFGLHDAADIQRSLTLVGATVTMDQHVQEGGLNFSLGERQIICLARLMLQNKQIIILDEPTSSVDNHSDARFQTALHKFFKGKTIITIAHRLDTLRGYDMVVELDRGRIQDVFVDHNS